MSAPLEQGAGVGSDRTGRRSTVLAVGVVSVAGVALMSPPVEAGLGVWGELARTTGQALTGGAVTGGLLMWVGRRWEDQRVLAGEIVEQRRESAQRVTEEHRTTTAIDLERRRERFQYQLVLGLEPTLAGRNLSGLPLPYIQLPDRDMTQANLGGADLTGANLAGADLTGANLSETNLTGASLHETDFTRSRMDGTILTRAELGGANLTGANLTGARLVDTYLARANLTVANLRAANLRGANLSLAFLSGAYLAGADLTGATLTGAYLTGANLTGTNLAGVKWHPDQPPYWPDEFTPPHNAVDPYHNSPNPATTAG